MIGARILSMSFRLVLKPVQLLSKVYWVRRGNWEGGDSTEVKWPGCEPDHSPPISADVKKT
jgi:hypothetical protein